MRNIALDEALVDHVGHEALDLLNVDPHADYPERTVEHVDRYAGILLAQNPSAMWALLLSK